MIKSDSSDKPWITPEIKRLISKRQVTWRRGNKPIGTKLITCVGVLAQSIIPTMLLIPLSRIHGSGGPLSKILLTLPRLKTFPHLCTTDSPIPIRLWPTCLMTSLLPLGIPCLRLLGCPSKSVIFLPTFTFQSTTPRMHYNPSSPFQLQVLTKSRLGSSVKIPRYYVAH